MALGRPIGSTKEKAFAEALRVAVNRPGNGGVKRLHLIADRLVTEAIAGEGWAIQQVADRLDGKPAQEATMTILRAVTELTDSEIAARIAALRGIGATDGDVAPEVDTPVLN